LIIVNITSGLGNQLFQYATAKALAQRNNDSLKLDLSYYSNFKDRKFSLFHYLVFEDIATLEEISQLKGVYKTNLILKLQRHFSKKGIEFYNQYHAVERPFISFEKDVLKLKGNIYLDGYWHNEKYFEDIKSVIQSNIQLKEKLSPYYCKIQKLIQKTNSVSIHIRRGDYLENNSFVICPLQYYDSAIKTISEKTCNPFFFIFSDDIDWAITHIKINSKFIFIRSNENSLEHVELILMSQCKHNIITNSTFSWWGAWLNINESKIIIRPTRYYNNKKAQRNLELGQFFPSSWIALNNYVQK
jgi:hypothetical protein